ncbi:EF-P lysine aminoacylase EpmA [Planctomicrobium piriforme]|uniref:Lysyl-tRNA synthetase, class 2 n=1 Tax=Planctomicrobium piriforme TaxID=1576369 RepID=A0A1I3HEZ4_9PLAN|nr:EF-P lysine aminoacylase EpmA [Planctomicrobium piriforme]SFI34179.1 lysyl-tRNA synthetase, class 2 [Planctomicrobium piriforme]
MTSDELPSATLLRLRQRAFLLAEVRAFFVERGHFEVQTPILSADCCVDAWIDPFAVPMGDSGTRYLQTSPEFALKRLLCAGADKVFEVARVFRQDEVGPRHNPEFTMIEWYERGTDHHVQMDAVEQLVKRLHSTAVAQGWITSSSLPSFSRLSYEQAFQQSVGLSPFTASLQELAAAALRTTHVLPAGIEHDRDGLLNLLLAEQVEPFLQKLGGVFVYDYPASQAALAKIRGGDAPVAERFELYLNRIEICNGYHELTEPAELQQRMQQQNAKRLAAGKPAIPVESRLLQAMTMHPLPDCAGVALGFDRLAMWCLGLTSIQEIIAFPFDRA